MKKLKICKGCNKSKIIWKSHKSDEFCQICWNKHPDKTNNVKPTTKKQKRIPPRSAKRVVANLLYLKQRSIFLGQHEMCEVRFPGCTNQATQVHHVYAGADRNKYFLDESTWKATCHTCHQHIHNNPKESRLLNLLK